MSQRVQSVVGWILALAIFAAAIYAVVRGVEKDPTIVGSFVTAAGAVAAVVWGRTREKKLELLQSHRAEMRPVYEELLTAFSTTTPDAGFMQEFQRKILVLGATSVLQAWLAFVRAQPPDGEPANLAFMLL